MRIQHESNRGSILAMVLILSLIVLTGTASLLSMISHDRKSAHAQNTKILANNVAEAGAYRALSVFKEAAADQNVGLGDMTDSEFASYITDTLKPNVNGGTGSQSVDMRVTADGSYQLVSLTRDASGDIYTIKATGSIADGAFGHTYESDVELDVEFLFNNERFGAAIISDMTPGSVGGGPASKSRAQDGNICFKIKVADPYNPQITVIGGILANGGAYITAPDPFTVDEDNISFNANPPTDTLIRTEYQTPINLNMTSSSDPVPDYTNASDTKQLFDFGRFIAASDAMHTAGNPTRFASFADFMVEVYAGRTFKGIIAVDIVASDLVKYKDGLPEYDADGNPKLQALKVSEDSGTNSGGTYKNVSSIDIEGTFLLNYKDVVLDGVNYGPVPPLHKLWGETTFNFNAPANVDTAIPAFMAAMDTYETDIASYESDLTTYETDWDAYQVLLTAYYDNDPLVGDPPVPPVEPTLPEVPTAPTNYPMFGSAGYTGPNPWDYTLPSPYKSFSVGDDFPAVMYNTGILDIHRNAFVSGLLYTPSFVEIEQHKMGKTQFFNGMIIAGGGILLESNKGDPRPLIVVFDSNAVDSLATAGLALKSPHVIAWRQK